MSSKITPIREGITTKMDHEREAVEFFQMRLDKFKGKAGASPTRLMIAMAGKGTDGCLYTDVRTWDMKEEVSRAENCGLAVMLFTRDSYSD